MQIVSLSKIENVHFLSLAQLFQFQGKVECNLILK